MQRFQRSRRPATARFWSEGPRGEVREVAICVPCRPPGTRSPGQSSTAQLSRLPEERALHLRAGKDVRDAVVLCCVLSVGAHSDYTLFDAACDQAFQRPVCTYLQPAQLGPQDSLYAQLHHSYQQLFKRSSTWGANSQAAQCCKTADGLAAPGAPDE